MQTSVLIVEDDAYTRENIAAALEGGTGSYAVTSVATLADAIEHFERERPAVILVDLGLPDGNGVELIERARASAPDTLALVISVFGDERSVLTAIEAGARGYLLKSEAPENLRLCVDQLLAGIAPISPGIAAHILRRLRDPAPESQATDDSARLTLREREVLELIVKGLSYKQAADTLGVTRETVASHVKNLYRKLEVQSRGEAVFEALSRKIVKL